MRSRDGDVIHAVIKGSAVNNDGSGKVGYLAPSVDGQAAAITEALAVAGVGAGLDRLRRVPRDRNQAGRSHRDRRDVASLPAVDARRPDFARSDR